MDCVLALAFAIGFNDDKKESYFQASKVQDKCPALVTDLQTATPESLPKVVETYQADLKSFSDSINAVQLQKDILYTYLQDLKSLNENSFEQYKSDFPQRAEGLFAKCDNKEAYINGFNGVNSYKELEKYVNKVEKEYNIVKQNYLSDREYLKAANALVGRASMINDNASANKKASDLQTLQDELKEFNSNANLENIVIVVVYILGLVAILVILYFALVALFKNFRSSYKILLVLVAFAVVFFIGYAIGTPTLSPSAIKFGMSTTGYKMVNAAAFSLYICLICAILAIIVMEIVNAVKNRK